MNYVICISKKGLHQNLPLTLGKMYEVLLITIIPFSRSRIDDPRDPFYKIIDDYGNESSFSKDRFRDLTTSEIRELKLNKLGI